jgi:hypothetical protein
MSSIEKTTMFYSVYYVLNGFKLIHIYFYFTLKNVFVHQSFLKILQYRNIYWKHKIYFNFTSSLHLQE